MKKVFNQKLYTYEEAAKLLGVSAATLRYTVKNKLLDVTHLESKPYISEASITSYLIGRAAEIQMKAKALQASAEVTRNWIIVRDSLAEYCAEEWKERRIYEHMMLDYINVDEPITLRWHSLDRKNKRLLYNFLLYYTQDEADFLL